MAKRFILFVALGMLLVSAQPVHALSDAEYRQLVKTSPEFRDADRRLSAFWKEIYGNLEGEYKKEVMAGQREWVNNGRDAAARKYMAQGMNKGQAYAKAVDERINVLRVIQENSQLSEDQAGSAKADDFYNAVDEPQGREAPAEAPFAPTDENKKLAMYVIAQSEAGGVEGQLERAAKALQDARGIEDAAKRLESNKLAWLYAVHAAYLADTSLSKEEAGKYQKSTVSAMRGALDALNVPMKDFETLLKETAILLDEANKQMLMEISGPDVAEEPKQPVKQAGAEEEKLLGLLRVAQNTHAKLETPRGRAFPLFTSSIHEAQEFDAKLAPVIIQKFQSSRPDGPIESAKIMEKCWQEIGYSYDATFYKAFHNLSPENFYKNQMERNFEGFLLLLALFQNETLLDKALAGGVLSRASAIAFLTANLGFIEYANQVGLLK